MEKIVSKFHTVLISDDAESIIANRIAELMELETTDSATLNDEIRRIADSVIQDLNNAIESSLRANNLPSNWVSYLSVK